MSNDLSESYIKLPNDIYDNVNISNEELTVLILMYRNYMQYKSIGICSVQLIAEYMRVDTSNNRKIINRINESIKGLIDKEYITGLYDLYYNEISFDDITKNKYALFYVELAEPPESNYFVIYDKDVNSIFEQLHSENISKFNIIRYFIACRRVSNNDSNFGYLTQGKLKQLVNDSRTIQRYNKILQDDLQLIRYDNNYLTEDKHYCTTFIGKWDDEKNFNNQLKAEVSVRGLIHTDKIKSNVKRSIKQKINNLQGESEAEKDKAKIKELEEKLRQLEFKLTDKKEEPVKSVRHIGKAKPKSVEVEEEEIDWDDTEDTSLIDINALLDDM